MTNRNQPRSTDNIRKCGISGASNKWIKEVSSSANEKQLPHGKCLEKKRRAAYLSSAPSKEKLPLLRHDDKLTEKSKEHTSTHDMSLCSPFCKMG